MFDCCNNLTSLDLSNFNTSKVTDMEYMFYECNKLTSLNLSNFDTSNVTDMRSMFDRCNNLTSLDLSNFNTSKVTVMNSMFYKCEKLPSLNLSSFDITSTTNREDVPTIHLMFSSCGISGTSKIKINPTQKDKFDTELSDWNYDDTTSTYTKN